MGRNPRKSRGHRKLRDHRNLGSPKNKITRGIFDTSGIILGCTRLEERNGKYISREFSIGIEVEYHKSHEYFFYDDNSKGQIDPQIILELKRRSAGLEEEINNNCPM